MSTEVSPELITFDNVIASISGFDEDETEDSKISIEGFFRAFHKLAQDHPDDFPVGDRLFASV